MKKRLLTIVLCASIVLSLALGATTAMAAEGGLQQLTQQDIVDIYVPEHIMNYQDLFMDEPVQGSSVSELDLTEEEKEQIREMNLVVAFEDADYDDPTKWQFEAAQAVCDDLNITVKDIWIAADQSGVSQLDDYQRFEAIADNYDAFFTLSNDTAATSEVLLRIMDKIDVGYWCGAPMDMDWNHPNLIGVTDANGYLAGKYSAEAAIKILGDTGGTIGTLGFINGRQGALHTVQKRYEGWDDVFAENPDVNVVQEWFENPAKASDIINSMLVSNPDMKVLLIDWANPPADQAQVLCEQLALVPWEDISIVTIDLDDTITVPMALDGPDNCYVGAFVTQSWYATGEAMMKMYAKHLLYGEDAPKFVATPPLPLTVYENLKTVYETATPDGYELPPEVTALENQWDLGVDNIWK